MIDQIVLQLRFMHTCCRAAFTCRSKCHANSFVMGVKSASASHAQAGKVYGCASVTMLELATSKFAVRCLITPWRVGWAAWLGDSCEHILRGSLRIRTSAAAAAPAVSFTHDSIYTENKVHALSGHQRALLEVLNRKCYFCTRGCLASTRSAGGTCAICRPKRLQSSTIERL